MTFPQSTQDLQDLQLPPLGSSPEDCDESDDRKSVARQDRCETALQSPEGHKATFRGSYECDVSSTSGADEGDGLSGNSRPASSRSYIWGREG